MEYTLIRITDFIKKELDNVRIFLRETYGVNPSYNDVVYHLLRNWNQRNSDRGPDRKETAQP